MPAKAPAKRPDQTSVLVRREQIMAAFSELVSQVPEAERGDIADILGPIVAADEWTALQESEGLPSSKTLVGRDLRLDWLARKPSEHPTASGFYLIAEGLDINSGEMLRWTAGGEQAVAVMSKLYVLKCLPAVISYSSVDITGTTNKAINCVVKAASPDKTING